MIKRIFPKIKYFLLPLFLFLVTTGASCSLKSLLYPKDPSTLTIQDVPIALNAIVNWLAVGAGSVCLIFIIIGGYLYISSLGSEEKAEQGKKTLIYSVVGFILVVGAYAIVKFFMSLMISGPKVPGGIF